MRCETTPGRAPAKEDFILYNAKGGAMDPDNLGHYFGDVLAGLGLTHVKYHAMRRAMQSVAPVARLSLPVRGGVPRPEPDQIQEPARPPRVCRRKKGLQNPDKPPANGKFDRNSF